MISTLAAAGSSGVSAAIPIIGQLAQAAAVLRQGGQHYNATRFVNDVEAPFGQALAIISATAKTDPVQARKLFAEAYSKYTDATSAAKTYGTQNYLLQKAADQSLGNANLYNTVFQLAAELAIDFPYQQWGQPLNEQQTAQIEQEQPGGVASGDDGVAQDQNVDPTQQNQQVDQSNPSTQTTIPGTEVTVNDSNGVGGLPGGVLIPAIGAGAAIGGGLLLGGNAGSAIPSESAALPPSAAGPAPSEPATANPVSKSMLDTLLPYILGSASVGSELYKAIAGAGTANDNTKLLSDAVTNANANTSLTSANALAENKRQFDIAQANQAPYVAAGGKAITDVSGMLPDLIKPFTEQRNFTADSMLKDPGYLRRLEDAQKALERSASAKGNLFSPGTTAAIASKVGAQASDEFAAADARDRTDYLDRYNIFTGNQNSAYNKEMGVASAGEGATQSINQAGANMTNANNQISQNSTTNINDLLTTLASITAQNNTNATNAKTTGASNIANDITSILAAIRKPAVTPARGTGYGA